MATVDSLSFVPGINLSDLRFTDDELARAEALIAESISARQPSLDLSPSTTIYDLLVRPAAVEYLNNRAMSESIRNTQSLKGVQENPALANDSVVDSILSNYGISRKAGSVATGYVRVNVSRNTTYSIISGQSFTSSNGAQFRTSQSYLALASPSDGDLLLRASDSQNDQFFFLLPVTATTVGVASQVADNVELVPDTSIANFISAYSFGAFVGALDQETNDQLIARIPQALSAKNRVSRSAIASELKDHFSEMLDVSVQGYDDEAMLRGVGGILPIKGGGFADIWVRTSLAPESVSTVLNATMETVVADRGTCSVTVPASAHPGHFFVASIRHADDEGLLGTFVILSQDKTIAASGHKIKNATQGALSAYQSSVVTFSVDPEEGQVFPLLGTQFSVTVETIGIPLIKEAQDLIDHPTSRVAGVDYLVRASVPCLVWIPPITVYVQSGAVEEDIRTAVFSYINHVKIGDTLSVDGIVMAIRSVAGVERVSLPIRIMGRVFCPDGSTIDLTSENALVIPNRPDIQVIPETTAFYVSVDDISLNVIVSS